MSENATIAAVLLFICLIIGAFAVLNEPMSIEGSDNLLTPFDTPSGRWLITGVTGIGSIVFAWLALRQYLANRSQLKPAIPLPPSRELQQRLRNNLHFTPAELQLNREGKLSQRQQEFFLRSLDPSEWRPFIIYLFVPLFGLFVYTQFINNTTSSHGLTQILIALMGLIGFPAIAITGAAFWAKWYAGRIDRWRIQVVEGPAHLSESEHDVVVVPLTAHRLKIGGRTFNLSGTQSKAFINGATYRIYFVKVWMPTILSAEFVSNE